jgi:hypothetical protein
MVYMNPFSIRALNSTGTCTHATLACAHGNEGPTDGAFTHDPGGTHDAEYTQESIPEREQPLQLERLPRLHYLRHVEDDNQVDCDGEDGDLKVLHREVDELLALEVRLILQGCVKKARASVVATEHTAQYRAQ